MDDKALNEGSRIVLVDNGSLNPQSVLEARKLAASLSERIVKPVDLASVAHSDEIPEKALGGVPAMSWESYWDEAKAKGIQELIAIPLFIGPGFALKKAKKQAQNRSSSKEKVILRWADPLVSRTKQDSVLSDILADNVIQVLNTGENRRVKTSVLLVDHGSPFAEVTSCRNFAAALLGDSLGDRVDSVVACSMERREGKAFDFNEPSLESALRMARSSGVERVVLSYLFLFSGRHAGPGGDIDQICDRSGWKRDQDLLKTDLIGSHPKILELLERRLNSIRSKR